MIPDEDDFDIYEELNLDGLKPSPVETASTLSAVATEKVSDDPAGEEKPEKPAEVEGESIYPEAGVSCC